MTTSQDKAAGHRPKPPGERPLFNEMRLDPLIMQDSMIAADEVGMPQMKDYEPTTGQAAKQQAWIEAATQPEPSVGGRSYAKIHRIKCQPPQFIDIAENRKTSDVRRADRDYQPGDFLVLNEYGPLDPRPYSYTGRHCFREITHVLSSNESALLTRGVVMLSIKPISPSNSIMEYLANNAEPEEIILKRHEIEERRAALNELARVMATSNASFGLSAAKIDEAVRENTATIAAMANEEPSSAAEASSIRRRMEAIRKYPEGSAPKNRFTVPWDIGKVATGEVAIDIVPSVPTGVFWDSEHGCFRNALHQHMGHPFGADWYERRGEFPQGSDALKMRTYLREHPHPEAAHPPRLKAIEVTTPHENELLLHLMQEAAEVIKEATKVTFFGKQTEPGPGAPLGYDNIEALSIEAGNLRHMLHVCEAAGLLTEPSIKLGIQRKLEGLDKHLTKR